MCTAEALVRRIVFNWKRQPAFSIENSDCLPIQWFLSAVPAEDVVRFCPQKKQDGRPLEGW